MILQDIWQKGKMKGKKVKKFLSSYLVAQKMKGINKRKKKVCKNKDNLVFEKYKHASFFFLSDLKG